MTRRAEANEVGQGIHGLPIHAKSGAGDYVMDTHRHILYAAMLAAILITDQGESALLFPVRTIVALGSALPAMVILATMMCMKTFEAAVVIVSVYSGHTGERLFAMLANEGSRLAKTQASLLSYSFALANTGAKALLMSGIPVRWIRGGKSVSTVVTRARDSLCGFAMGFTCTFAGAVFALLFGSIEEGFATEQTDIFEAGNASGHFYTSGSISRNFFRGTFPGKNACQRFATLL